MFEIAAKVQTEALCNCSDVLSRHCPKTIEIHTFKNAWQLKGKYAYENREVFPRHTKRWGSSESP